MFIFRTVLIMKINFHPFQKHYLRWEEKRLSMERDPKALKRSPVSDHLNRHWLLQQPDNSKFGNSTKDNMSLLTVLDSMSWSSTRSRILSRPTTEIS